MYLDAYSNFRFYAVNTINDTLALAMIRYEMASTEEQFYVLIQSNDQCKTWTQFSSYNFATDNYKSIINNIGADKNLSKIIVSGVKRYWLSFDAGLNWEIIDAEEMGSINDIIPAGNDYIFATQKGTFNVDSLHSTLLNDQYAFDAIFTPDSLLISGKNEATTFISDINGEKWLPFGVGINSTYYDFATFGNWIYALRKGTESFRTPIWFAEKQKALINYIDHTTYANAITLLPNPVQSADMIHLLNTETNYSEVRIVDISGKEISRQTIDNNCFKAPDKSGIYIINLTSSSVSITAKLIVD